MRAHIWPCRRACGRVHAKRRFGVCLRAVRVGCRNYGWGSRFHAWGGPLPTLSSTSLATAGADDDVLYVFKFSATRP